MKRRDLFRVAAATGAAALTSGLAPVPALSLSLRRFVDRYGDYDLRRGDTDASTRYAGTVRSVANGDEIPSNAVTDGFVRRLQLDLKAIGFALVGDVDGVFGMQTLWAVREFQIYAGMPRVAQEVPPQTPETRAYTDRLSSALNIAPYNGPISGVVNAETRATLQIWLSNRWRCPVVIQGWTVANNAPVNVVSGKDNLWLHNDLTDTAPRVFFRDYSGYYSYPAGHPENALHVLGTYAKFPPNQTVFSGPQSVATRHTWRETEVTPLSLLGTDVGQLTDVQRSTFKAIRAVAEQECYGFFDSANAYDSAIASFGLYHWTLLLIKDSTPVTQGTAAAGELGAFLAYLKWKGQQPNSAASGAFDRFFGRFGLQPAKEWTNPDGSAALFETKNGTYINFVSQQNDNGTFTPIPSGWAEAEADYFRSWHWFLRFMMAMRDASPAGAACRVAMGDMARLRIRDILQTAWGDGLSPISVPGGGSRPTRIGDVFTSERGIAMLLRWHVNRPSDIVRDGKAGPELRAVFKSFRDGLSLNDRQIIDTTPASGWNSPIDIELRLIKSILDRVQYNTNQNILRLFPQMQNINAWPTWTPGAPAGALNKYGYQLPSLGKLSDLRNSFLFDGAGLPPPAPV